MSKWMKGITLAALLSAPVSYALADDADMSVRSTDTKTVAVKSEKIKTPRSGWYIGGGLGLGGHLETWNLATLGKGSSYQPFPSVAVDLGYQFLPYFAMGLYAFTDAYHWADDGSSGYDVAVPIQLYLKGILPLNDRWSIYAKAGLGGSAGGPVAGDVLYSLGLGSTYQMTKSLAFTMEFDMHYGVFENIFDGLFGNRHEIYTPALMFGVTYFF